eukprot:gene10035-10191_t
MNSFRKSSIALRSSHTAARVRLRICCCKPDAGRSHSPAVVPDRALTTAAAARVPAPAEAVTSSAAAATLAVNTNVANKVNNGPVQTPVKHFPLVWEKTEGGTQAYGALFLWLLLGNVTALQQWHAADFIYFVGLAVLTVYIGAHKGLTSRSKQQLQLRESILAPVLASCSLFGLYLLIKYLPNFSLQTFLDAYFWLLGTVAISNAARPVISKLSSPLKLERFAVNVEVPPGLLADDEQGGSVQNVLISPADVAAVLLGMGLATYELLGHHTNFTLNNMVACLVATEILALVDIKSFRAAGLLLLGLMAYDVFWVFGSPKVVGDNVMLTVATSDLIVGPTRLLFPRGTGGTGEAADFPFSLLGLGDIAIPGLMLPCSALRPLKEKKYFKNATVAHVAGLLSAFAANSISHLGQPALLYIVPAMSLAVLGTAASKAELGQSDHGVNYWQARELRIK